MHEEKSRDFDSPEYKSWRYSVFARDNFTCQMTGQKGVPLEAHHIKTWAKHPNLRYAQSNGITLSKEMHEMITGKEEQYEKFFAEIVKKNTLRAYKRKGENVPGKKTYRPRNPRLRY